MMVFDKSDAFILGTLSFQSQSCQRSAPLTLMIAFQVWCIHFGNLNAKEPNLETLSTLDVDDGFWQFWRIHFGKSQTYQH